MNEKGNFMWAVEMMKQGKKVRRNQHKDTLTWANDGRFYVLLHSGEKDYCQFSISHIEATDWEVVEEPKKTLYQKRNPKTINSYMYAECNVSEALKEFYNELWQWKNGGYGENLTINREDFDSRFNKIFGEELLK